MCVLSRLAIFALVSNEDASLIRLEQNRLTELTRNSAALGFPVHITLKGRFLACEGAVKERMSSFHLRLLCQLQEKAIIYFSQPRYIEPNLSWLEVLPNSETFSSLIHLHQILEQEMKELVLEDEVPLEHKYLSFRPHITLGWGVTPQIWDKYSTNTKFNLRQARISHIALACYSKDWPVDEGIDIILKIPIQ